MNDIELHNSNYWMMNGSVHDQKLYKKKDFLQHVSVESQPSKLLQKSQHEVLGKLILQSLMNILFYSLLINLLALLTTFYIT